MLHDIQKIYIDTDLHPTREIFTNSLKIELTRFSIRNILPHF